MTYNVFSGTLNLTHFASPATDCQTAVCYILHVQFTVRSRGRGCRHCGVVWSHASCSSSHITWQRHWLQLSAL